MNLRSHCFPQKAIQFLIVAFLLAGCQSSPQATPTSTVENTATPLPTSTPEATPTPLTENIKVESQCEESSILTFSLSSELLNDTLSFNVYFPPCYDPHTSQPYPVIYLLHGQEQDASLWRDIGIQAAADQLILEQSRQPFLIVMPVEQYYFRSSENNRYPDAIMEELIPAVESDLPVCAERECRAIGGVSRGGAWAARLAFQNWDVFGTLGAHSTPLFEGDLEILPEWVDTISSDSLPRIYADVGSTDPAVKDAYAFDQALNALGVPHEWHLNSGRHNEEYWSAHIYEYLSWYTSAWMKE